MYYPEQRTSLFFCLAGPAGAGKSTLCQNLLQDFEDLEFSISVTSRSPFSDEQEGVDYCFVDEETFRQKIHAEEFFEWEETHGNFYGTPQSTIDSVLNGKSDVILDIDIRGAMNFRRKFPSRTVILLILPPSFDAIEERIRDRTEISEEDIRRRIETAKMEYRLALDLHEKGSGIDYLIVNDDFSTAYWTVQGIIYAERAKFHRVESGFLKNLSKFE